MEVFDNWWQPWTALDRQALRAGYARQQASREIARALGRSPESVRLQAAALGIPFCKRRQWYPALDDRIVEMWNEGHAAKVIAWELKRSPQAIRTRVSKTLRDRCPLRITPKGE